MPCESTDHPDIRCTFVKTPVSVVGQIATTFDVLTITGLFEAIPAGGKFEFRTKDGSFKNPPTTKAITTFKAKSLAAFGLEIDT